MLLFVLVWVLVWVVLVWSINGYSIGIHMGIGTCSMCIIVSISMNINTSISISISISTSVRVSIRVSFGIRISGLYPREGMRSASGISEWEPENHDRAQARRRGQRNSSVRRTNAPQETRMQKGLATR